jgi:Ni/Co efflux regulator RcnB
MHPKFSKTNWLMLAAISIIFSAQAIADKPSWAGGGKPDKHRQNERYNDRDDQRGNHNHKHDHDKQRSNFSGGRYFIDQHRIVIRDYYDNRYRSGRCPPGLAKKHNGCVPPGQVKNWQIGRPLPRNVIFYDLPPAVLYGIGPPPPGYRFVRVASDILMIAVGTGMVIDAINDLGRY